MKVYILATFLLFAFKQAPAQRYQEDNKVAESDLFRVTIPIKNDFKDQHIKSISLLFGSDTLRFATVRPDPTDSSYIQNNFLQSAFASKNRFYDLGFEADYYVFKNNYPQIQVPKTPDARRMKFAVNGNIETIKHYSISEIRMYTDSTTFIYTHGYKWNEKSYFGFPAKYKENLEDVEDQISRDMKSSHSDVSIDSVLVYEAVISLTETEIGRTREEEFELKRLLFGRESAFSTVVEKNLKARKINYYNDGKSKWTAAILATSGRPIESKIKVYVRLNKDRSVTIKLPRMLGNFTGD
ncbi:MAG: hypothetical protein ACTIJ8_15915 [Sphingobacterium sp.]